MCLRASKMLWICFLTGRVCFISTFFAAPDSVTKEAFPPPALCGRVSDFPSSCSRLKMLSTDDVQSICGSGRTSS